MSGTKIAKSGAISKAEPFSSQALPQIGGTLAPPDKMSDDKLAEFVAVNAARVAVFCEQLKPYYWELRIRFANKKSKSDTIHGCKSWDEYCAKVLDRTKRAVNYWLSGGNKRRGRVLPKLARASSHLTSDARARLQAFQEQVEERQRQKSGGKQFPTQAQTIETRHAKEWLTDALQHFEACGFASIDPVEIHLTRVFRLRLSNCKNWMEKILAGRSRSLPFMEQNKAGLKMKPEAVDQP